MEDSLTPEPAASVQPPACANCGQPPLKGDYPTLLCGECREAFVKFPIPVWIWAFAGGILVIMFFGFFKFPADVSIAVNLERGRKASAERRYMTAEMELKKAAAKLPREAEANARLLIAAYYNSHYDLFVSQVRKVVDFKFENNELFQETDRVIAQAEILLTSDSLKDFSASHPNLSHIPDTAWQHYFSRNANDNGARIVCANELLEGKRLKSCDSVIGIVSAAYPGDFRTLMLAASSKREQGQYDSALYYNQRILALNSESVDGLASEARTLLRQKKDAEALKVASRGYDLDKADSYAQASLILAYHFNERTAERDALIKKAMQEAKDSSDKTSVQYALDVIEKREKFRD